MWATSYSILRPDREGRGNRSGQLPDFPSYPARVVHNNLKSMIGLFLCGLTSEDSHGFFSDLFFSPLKGGPLFEEER